MMHRSVRVMLAPVLAALALAGCGSEGARDDGRAGTSTGSVRLRPPPSRPAPGFADDSQPPVDGFPAPLAEDDSSPPSIHGQDAAPDGRCDPNYEPCVPVDRDVDCAGGRGNGPSYVAGPVRVVGRDVYGLDRDGDGIGCEN